VKKTQLTVMAAKANWPITFKYEGSFQEAIDNRAIQLRSDLEKYLQRDGDPRLQGVVDQLLRDLLNGVNVLWELQPKSRTGRSSAQDRAFSIVEEMYRLRKDLGLEKPAAKEALIKAMKSAGEHHSVKALDKQIDRALLAWGPYMPINDDKT
jgi:hypothetical protein